MNDEIVRNIEKGLLIACGVLLLFFYLYVYAFGKVRGPLAREAYYRLGDISPSRIQVRMEEHEKRNTESLMLDLQSADE